MYVCIRRYTRTYTSQHASKPSSETATRSARSLAFPCYTSDGDDVALAARCSGEREPSVRAGEAVLLDRGGGVCTWIRYLGSGPRKCRE